MGGITDLYESFIIYSESFSYFYLLCVCTSFAAVIFAWKINGAVQSSLQTKTEITPDPIERQTTSENCLKANEGSQTSLNQSDSSTSSGTSGPRLLHSNKRALLESLDDNLDENELANEKEIENQQLAHIFEFMKKESDKFEIGSVEELEDQMRQYYKK